MDDGIEVGFESGGYENDEVMDEYSSLLLSANGSSVTSYTTYNDDRYEDSDEVQEVLPNVQIFNPMWMPGLRIEVKSVSRRPRALAIVLGWLGSKQKHLDKYSKLWLDRDCDCITVISPMLSIMTGLGIRQVTKMVLREANKIVRRSELSEAGWGQLPVLLHIFSNGGAFVLEDIMDFIQYWTRQTKSVEEFSSSGIFPCCGYTESRRLLRHNCDYVSHRLSHGCLIFDSAPCYLHYSAGAKALGEANVHLPMVLRLMLQSLFLLFARIMDLFSYILSCGRVKRRAIRFWQKMMNCKMSLSHVYVYSTNDDVTDHQHLDRLVRCYKMSERINVLKVLRFGDSKHVQHLRKHKCEYEEMIDYVLDSLSPNYYNHLNPGEDDELWGNGSDSERH